MPFVSRKTAALFGRLGSILAKAQKHGLGLTTSPSVWLLIGLVVPNAGKYSLSSCDGRALNFEEIDAAGHCLQKYL